MQQLKLSGIWNYNALIKMKSHIFCGNSSKYLAESGLMIIFLKLEEYLIKQSNVNVDYSNHNDIYNIYYNAYNTPM